MVAVNPAQTSNVATGFPSGPAQLDPQFQQVSAMAAAAGANPQVMGDLAQRWNGMGAAERDQATRAVGMQAGRALRATSAEDFQAKMQEFEGNVRQAMGVPPGQPVDWSKAREALTQRLPAEQQGGAATAPLPALAKLAASQPPQAQPPGRPDQMQPPRQAAGAPQGEPEQVPEQPPAPPRPQQRRGGARQARRGQRSAHAGGARRSQRHAQAGRTRRAPRQQQTRQARHRRPGGSESARLRNARDTNRARVAGHPPKDPRAGDANDIVRFARQATVHAGTMRGDAQNRYLQGAAGRILQAAQTVPPTQHGVLAAGIPPQLQGHIQALLTPPPTS